MSLPNHAKARGSRMGIFAFVAVMALFVPAATASVAFAADDVPPVEVTEADVIEALEPLPDPAPVPLVDEVIAPEVIPTDEANQAPAPAPEQAPEPDPAPALEQATELALVAPLAQTMTTTPVVDPTPYVLVAWKMPAYTNATTPHWPQSSPHAIDLATKDLSALDSWVAEQPYGCYQIDGYNDNATTTSLIAGGHLDGAGNPPESLWGGGWGVDYKVVQVGAGCTPPPPVDVCPSDFASTPMWEVTWGYGFADRNGGAPLFTMASNGGLVGINDGPVPAYMTNYGDGDDWYWLYINKPAVDRVVTYQFADGTERQATITGDANGCPGIVWTETPPVVEVTPVAPTFTPPTCEASGTLVADDTDLYLWIRTGPDSAIMLQAVAITAGANLIGQSSFGPYDLRQLTGEECAPPPTPVVCESFEANSSTNLDHNGWTLPEGAQYVEGGIELTVPGDWGTVAISRPFVGPLADIGTGVDISATPIQYVGIHVTLSNGAVITYEEEGSYAGKWWSESNLGVAPGMGYATFDTLENIVAANPGLTTTLLRVLYTSPTASSTVITLVKTGCTAFTFDYQESPPELVDTISQPGSEPPTCTEPGHRVDAAPQEGVTIVWTEEEEVVGINHWTAVFDPGFAPAEGLQVSGTVTVEAALGYQTADPEAACFNRPEPPDPEQDSQTTYDCQYATTHTRATTWVWNETNGRYDQVVTESSSKRLVTADEIKANNLTCPTPPPPPPTCPSGTTWVDVNHNSKADTGECRTVPGADTDWANHQQQGNASLPLMAILAALVAGFAVISGTAVAKVIPRLRRGR